MAAIDSVTVVVPVFNERESVAPLVAELLPVLDGLGITADVVFVDDGSTDGTREALTTLAESDPRIRAVLLRRNFGKGAALMAGFREAGGTAIVTMDGDLQDDPAEIPRLLAGLEEGADLVSGWKADRRDPRRRRLASWFFNAATRRATGIALHDLNCGLKAYRREVVQALALTGDLYRYIPVLAAAEGFRVHELAVNHRPRRFGRTKFGLERYLRGLLDLITLVFIGRFRNRPMHLFGGLGLLTTMVGIGISIYLTILKLTGTPLGNRPLLQLGVLLIVVGIQFVTIGLLSELMQRNHLRREIDEVGVRIERVVGDRD